MAKAKMADKLAMPFHARSLLYIFGWEEKGFYVFNLPAYSPHLNIIETLWRKMKYKLFETSKQLTSYAGLVTSTRQSNETTRHGKITKQGRKRLRTVAIRAVLSMINRTSAPLMDFYERKKKEKGSGKAICATARKLLTIVFVMLKKELDYWYLEDRLYNSKLRDLNKAVAT